MKLTAEDEARLERIRARWAGIDVEGYEIRREGDDLIVYGSGARRDLDGLTRALYSAADDVRVLNRLIDVLRSEG